MVSTGDATSSCKVVLAGGVAKKLLEEISEGLKQLGKPPLLVGFLANQDPAARMYADWTGRTCKENMGKARAKVLTRYLSGFRFELREVDREELEEHILAANQDNQVDGIIVYYPIFGSRQDQYLQQITDVTKDVEGLSHRYIFNMYQNVRFLDEQKMQKSVLPCTPLAVIKILEHLQLYNTILPYGNRLFGRSITVINRSEVVGRPLAALLANDGASVYSVDVTGVQQFTRGEGIKNKRHEVLERPNWSLEDCLPLSDIVISGVPGDSFKVPTRLLREGAVCINFSSEKNFGPEVKQKASIYVPAIGKVTIVVLLRNLLRIVQNRKSSDVTPAAAVEKSGTVEEAAPPGR
ncbi:MAG: rRNA-binding ribosome biosynthesis protein rpf2 [Chaenotheca gracillima]|nr:MAG: rRNA-binding ribosome biosynthesis protein rpf2 [Chaenotheca gracillima]